MNPTPERGLARVRAVERARKEVGLLGDIGSGLKSMPPSSFGGCAPISPPPQTLTSLPCPFFSLDHGSRSTPSNTGRDQGRILRRIRLSVPFPLLWATPPSFRAARSRLLLPSPGPASSSHHPADRAQAPQARFPVQCDRSRSVLCLALPALSQDWS